VHACNQTLIIVQEEHVSDELMTACVADLQNHGDTLRREDRSVLAIPFSAAWKRDGVKLLVAPQDTHLQPDVDDQRITNPRTAKRIGHPVRRRRGSLRSRRDPQFGIPFDIDDAVKMGSVEKNVLVRPLRSARVDVGIEPFRNAIHRGCGCRSGEQRPGPGVQRLLAGRRCAAKFNVNLEPITMLRRFGRDHTYFARPVTENDTLENTKIVKTTKQQAGVVVERCMPQPFKQDSHR